MANCLVTKLKGVVDNNNLDYLDYIKITGEIPSSFTSANIFAVRNSSDLYDVRLLNTDGATIEWQGVYCAFTKGSGNKIELLFPRYKIDNLEIYNSGIVWNYKKICSIYGLTSFTSSDTTVVNTSDIKFENVVNFEFSEGLAGTIDEIVKMPKIQILNLSYNRGLTGDLGSIKDMPNLTKVTLNGTYVTDTTNAVAYMQNRGIEVTYVPYDN